MLNSKVLNIKNGPQILLMSDPKANKTSVSLDIRTGSMNDPKDAPGLSHLVEHMLFKGSAQYPNGNLLSSILYSNQGVYSAVTGPEHSSFSFEVANDSFKQALAVFSSFFKEPVFREKDISGEISIIDNEFSLNKKDPDTLCRYLLNSIGVKGHPLSKFFHGNKKTLKDIDEAKLRALFALYLAAPKKAALCGRLPLAELEELALINFSSMKSDCGSVTDIFGPIFNKEKTPDVIYVDSVGGRPFLRLCFETQSMYGLFRSKPNWILSSLMNSERSGSVIDVLRRKGFAEEIWASFNNMSFASFFNIDVLLTSKGLTKPFDVSGHVFSYLDLLRQEGCRDYIYKEQSSTAQAGFKFKEHREGALYARGLARNMHYYDAEKCEEQSELIYEYSENDFRNLIGETIPERSRQVVYGAKLGSCKKDKYYGVKYDHSEQIKLKPIKRSDEISYPGPNCLVPEDFSHVKDDGIHYPRKIVDGPKGTVWFMSDWELGLPHVYINLLILSPCVNKSPKDKLSSILYAKMLNESLRDVADMAGEAGLTFGIERSDRGIAVYFAGYSNKIFDLYKKVLDAFACDMKDKDLLGKIKRSLSSDYKELEHSSSYAVAQYYKYDLMHKTNINYLKYFKMIDAVQLKDINSVRRDVFKQFAVESYIYGNINSQEAIKIVDGFFERFDPKELPSAERPKDRIIKNPRGSSYSYSLNCKTDDSCWASYYDFGRRNIRLSAVIQLGFGFLKGFFFNEMRNKKNLGYLVESRLDFFEHVLGISFAVCSDSSDTATISKEAKNVFKAFIEYLEFISEEELKSSRESLIAGISKNNRTIEEWMSEIVLTAAVNGDPDYGKKLCVEIGQVTRTELLEVFSSSLCGTGLTAINVCANGRGSKNKKTLEETVIADIYAYKRSVDFYQ